MAHFLHDHEGRKIRLTEERLEHIQNHPEMRGRLADISRVLANPERVVESTSDHEARLYYRYFFDTAVGDKYLCAVVKIRPSDSFVLTAYFTDTIKGGPRLWPK